MSWAVALLAAVAAAALVGLIVSWRSTARARAEADRLIASSERELGDFDLALAQARGLGEQLERALDAIPQGVIVFDGSGNLVFRNRFAAVNESARHGDALVVAAAEQLVDEALKGVHGSREVELFGPPRRTLVITAAPLADGDRACGAICLVEDVTERKHLDAVRRDFVANISHELKTPVGALSLLAETLLAEDDPEISRRLTARMVGEALRVNRTIEDLLELSRIETEGSQVHEAVPVQLLVAEAVERIHPAAAQRAIPVTVADVDPRLAVIGDRRQLVSALCNLLDNAVKYSDSGSPVTVRARSAGRFADIAVEDHGIGIPTSDRERVFERFYRVDAGRSRQTGGTGLGLAIVRHVVVNHEGEITVESRLGEGSTFTMSLPAAPEPVAEVPATEVPAGRDSAGQVQLVTGDAAVGGLGSRVTESGAGERIA